MAQYPGYNTDFFVVLNGVVTGPLTGLEEVFKYNITPDTPVWYDGLPDWQPAIMTPLTRQIFTPGSEFHRFLIEKQSGADVETSPIPENTPTAIPEDNSEIPPEIPAADDEVPPVIPAQQFAGAGSQQAQYMGAMPQQAMTPNGSKQPSSYLVWSIVITFLCNLLCGVVAIIYSLKVKSKLRAGNIEGAKRCSERAQWWIASSIVVGLVFLFINLVTGSILSI